MVYSLVSQRTVVSTKGCLPLKLSRWISMLHFLAYGAVSAISTGKPRRKTSPVVYEYLASICGRDAPDQSGCAPFVQRGQQQVCQTRRLDSAAQLSTALTARGCHRVSYKSDFYRP